MLKVLALAADAYGGYGGIARSTQDILEAFVRWRDVSIDILPRHARSTPLALPAAIRQYPASSGRLRFAAGALDATVRIKPDLIYCGHLFMSPLAAGLARLVGAKLIVHLHGLELWAPLNTFRRSGLKQANVALCVSSDTARRAREAASLSDQQVRVIHNTVGDAFVPANRASARGVWGLSQEIALLTVSRLDARQRHKGHDLVIPLLVRLREEGRNVIYLIAGDGDDRERLESLAKTCGVAKHVRFLGRVADDKLPSLYSAADFYVMPSSGEGFGIAFVEAMCCGTPAIGLALGGAPDALADGVLGVAARPEDFANALIGLVAQSPRDRDALARQTRARFGRDAFQQRVNACLDTLFSETIMARTR